VPWWPSLWQRGHWSIGGLASHFLKVIAFPNIARWDFDMACVMELLGSRKVKERLEKGLVSGQVGCSQCGCRMNCRSAHSGFCLILLRSCCPVKNLFVSGSLVGTPLKVTLKKPVEGTKTASGKGCLVA
jgi:hypothetical protein